ncbi:vitamin-B12 independent methionine synthase [Williamsia sp. CHRR-6]|nr:vitamin-B12 independent methionine synthase [Williamsia sp. CHRR-6]
MPGDDPRAAVEVIAGEVGLIHLPELPGRGLGADMIGRACAVLADMPMEVATTGYRLSARPSAMSRRARDLLRTDVDALEEIWETGGHGGPDAWVKTQVCGPFTLAASVETSAGHKAVRDRGAWADLVDSLAEGVAVHAAELQRRLGVPVLVQIDEPLLDRVIDGAVKPLSRFDVIDPIPAATIAEHYDRLIDVVGRPVLLHLCSDTIPWTVAAQSSVWGVAFDLAQVGRADLDGIGELLDRATVLAVGAVPATEPGPEVTAEAVAAQIVRMVDTIGLDRRVLSDSMLVTPTCGLAQASTSWSRTALAIATAVATELPRM